MNVRKRILFISPKYFGYEIRIKQELEKQNYDVTWFDDRPKMTIFEKGLQRMNPSFFKKRTNHYFEKEIYPKFCEENYDFVFVILGQSFTRNQIKKLRDFKPDCRFILYLWDSIYNFPQCLDLSSEFDCVYSFDYNDCRKYNFNFLPLFYTFTNDNDEELKYDFSCVCTIKKGKIKNILSIKEQLDKNYRTYFYLYIQSKAVYFFYKIFDKDFRHTKSKFFRYKKLTYEQNLKLIGESKCIIDVQMGNQNGLTMRTFESLAYNKRLLTTNNDIRKYDFFDEKNIYVYDGKLDFSSKFFTCFAEKNEMSESFFNIYSITHWIKELIN